MQKKERNPEDMNADPSQPKKQIHPTEDREHQQQDGKITVGRRLEQLVQERTALRDGLPQRANGHRKAKQDAKRCTQTEREGWRGRVQARDANPYRRKYAEVHHLIATEIEPFSHARLFAQNARKIAIHAIDHGRKLQDEGAEHETSGGEKPG